MNSSKSRIQDSFIMFWELNLTQLIKEWWFIKPKLLKSCQLHTKCGIHLHQQLPYHPISGCYKSWMISFLMLLSIDNLLIFLLDTRPDLAFTIQHLSQFKKTPCQAHYQAAVHVLKYLKRIIDQAILINNDSSYQLEAYYDSDQVVCLVTR